MLCGKAYRQEQFSLPHFTVQEVGPCFEFSGAAAAHSTGCSS